MIEYLLGYISGILMVAILLILLIIFALICGDEDDFHRHQGHRYRWEIIRKERNRNK